MTVDRDPDPNEAHEIVPMKPEPHGPPGDWWTVTRNGIPDRHFLHALRQTRRGCTAGIFARAHRHRLNGVVQRFCDPIVLPDGRKLLTLRDAAEYITARPKAEHDAADWQLAMEALLLMAERKGRKC